MLEKNNSPQTAVIIEDHPLFIKSLQPILLDLDFTEVLMEKTGQGGIGTVLELRPGLVLVDIGLPDISGFEVIKTCKPRCPDALFIVLSMHEDPRFARRALDLGVDGYLAKSDDEEAVRTCIREVRAGGAYVSKSLEAKLAEYSCENPDTETLQGVADFSSLTQQERRILYLLYRGKTSKEIGIDLNISYRTVQNHRSNICTKLNLRGTNVLLRFVVDNAELLFSDMPAITDALE